ncbi:MAG: hypothetical protein WAV38_33590 [Xanthobacteraceae bacterium]
MFKQSKYAASELLNEPVTTGGANTNDWLASMRGMMLLYTDGDGGEVKQQSEGPHHRKNFNKDRT